MKPYYDKNGITIYQGDCREVLPLLQPVDLVIADPPYGETSLKWDIPADGWLSKLPLKSSGSLWCFGTMRMFMNMSSFFQDWIFAQDLVWEKHNGPSPQADRFRRVHEHIAHFYKGKWSDIYKSVQTTPDAIKRTVHRKTRPEQWGDLGDSHFSSQDGGPRMMRSVIRIRSCHGNAMHPTQKPLGIIAPIIKFSCPKGGIVLDPFTGSGSVLCVAKQLGMKAIGIEIEKKYCELAVQRLAQEFLFT